jgi:predicted TIM-barrel fold metal-dependent hydrolase
MHVCDPAGAFAAGNDLVDLPWFTLRDGRVALQEPLGPIVDVHGHLALSYVRRRTVDLRAETPQTEHYLDMAEPLDLGIYANQNIGPEGRSAMSRDLTLGSMSRSGMRASHTAPNLRREMADLGIARTLLLPVELPMISGNADAFLGVAAEGDGLISFGSVHPADPRRERQVHAQIARGALGFKLHPAVQLFRPDARRPMELMEILQPLGLPLLFHCGPVGIELPISRRMAQVRHFEGMLAAFREVPVILGHSGALQMDEALELSRRHDNVWLDVSCQCLPNLRRILERGDPDRLLFGSDWPFYHQAVPLAKVLLATQGQPALRRKVLWENAGRLLGERARAAA